MRDLKFSDKNIFAVFDNVSGSGLRLYYRTIQTMDRIEYEREIMEELEKQRKNKNQADFKSILKIQLKWADDFITGIVEGDWCYDGKIISSDPQSPNYYELWKQFLNENAGEVILKFVQLILGTPNTVIKADDPNFFSMNLSNTTNNGRKKKKNTTKN